MADRPEIQLKWQGKLYRLTHDAHGRRFVHYLEAERALGLINDQIQRKAFWPSEWVSASANRMLWENYLADFLGRQKAEATRATYEVRRALARHLAWFNGRNIKEIRTAHVQDFAALPCLHLALAPVTRSNLMATLATVFREAVRREDIERAPQIPRVVVPEREVAWMMPEEQALALAHIPAKHRPIFAFLMLYGCRVSEACALCWDAVDRAKGVISFRRTFSRGGELKETTKGRHEDLAPIYDDCARLLADLPQGIGPTPVFRNPDAHVAANPLRWYGEYILRKYWRRALTEAGLPYIHLKNATRHSLGMQIVNVMDGGSLELASAALRHRGMDTTRKYYARPTLALLKSLRDGVDKGRVVNLLATEKGEAGGDK
jgi:integrase